MVERELSEEELRNEFRKLVSGSRQHNLILLLTCVLWGVFVKFVLPELWSQDFDSPVLQAVIDVGIIVVLFLPFVIGIYLVFSFVCSYFLGYAAQFGRMSPIKVLDELHKKGKISTRQYGKLNKQYYEKQSRR